MRLKDIHSQEQAVGRLQRGFSAGRTAHAYLFTGADGVGKRTAAQAFAKMLLCHDRKKTKGKEEVFYDSCGVCRSCTLFEAGTHPDYKMISKELVRFTRQGKDRTTPVEMPIDVIREFVLEKVSVKPAESEYSVFVIEEAEKVNDFSQNAMLKILEEPPPSSVLILLCSRVEEMLATTRSRCQIVPFGPVEESYIAGALQQERVQEAEALYWARFSEGSIGKALAWATLDPGEKSPRPYAMKKELVEKTAGPDLADVLDIAGWISDCAKAVGCGWSRQHPELSTTDLNRRAQKGMILMVLHLLSDVIRLHCGKDQKLVNSDQISIVNGMADRLDAETAADKIIRIQKLLRWVDASVNERLIFERLLFDLARCDIVSVLSD